MVSKALVTAAYQRKAEEIARLGVELTVLAPPAWQDRRGAQFTRPSFTQGYLFKIIPMRLNGNYHLHFYPTLAAEIAQIHPQIVHMDEEPYNLATWLGLRAAERYSASGTFFTWQNLDRHYPPPFRWFEQAAYRRTAVAIAGNRAAAAVLRRKGYRGDVEVIPQFGVDPAIFCPDEAKQSPKGCLQIGYAGGLVPEKGVDLLMQACSGLRGNWQLQIAGEGSERTRLQAQAKALGVAPNVHLHDRLESTKMPSFYRQLDVLVLPSYSLPNWKEQFGRVLIEAMACAVAVVGSDCGEIPNVIGDSGLIFAERDVAALRAHLQFLLEHPAECRRLGQAGRQRVLANYTMARVAQQTVSVYGRLLE